LEELEVFFRNDEWYDAERALRIDDVHKYFPIEVMRNRGETCYSVYKTREGGNFYVFWDDHDYYHAFKKGEVGSAIHLQPPFKDKNDFKKLKNGVATAQDVYEIDDDFYFCGIHFMFLKPDVPTTFQEVSYSLLKNDKVMVIEYKIEKIYDENGQLKEDYGRIPLRKKDYTVVNKEVFFREDVQYSWFSYILPGDMP
jgi:hypothetical protein